METENLVLENTIFLGLVIEVQKRGENYFFIPFDEEGIELTNLLSKDGLEEFLRGWVVRKLGCLLEGHINDAQGVEEPVKDEAVVL